MKTFIISDTHFDHANIIKYCERPFANTNEMNLTIIKRWNEVIKKHDKVFFLGDFCLGGVKQITHFTELLNGRKHIILGNHDRQPSIYIKAGFETAYSYPIIVDDFFILSHQPVFLSTSAPYVNIHGHTHDTSPELLTEDGRNMFYNVCVEKIDYRPINLQVIKDYYRLER